MASTDTKGNRRKIIDEEKGKETVASLSEYFKVKIPKKAKLSDPKQDFVFSLPNELWVNVFLRVPLRDISKTLPLVSKKFHSICSGNEMWTRICLRVFPERHKKNLESKKLNFSTPHWSWKNYYSFFYKLAPILDRVQESLNEDDAFWAMNWKFANISSSYAARTFFSELLDICKIKESKRKKIPNWKLMCIAAVETELIEASRLNDKLVKEEEEKAKESDSDDDGHHEYSMFSSKGGEAVGTLKYYCKTREEFEFAIYQMGFPYGEVSDTAVRGNLEFEGEEEEEEEEEEKEKEKGVGFEEPSSSVDTNSYFENNDNNNNGTFDSVGSNFDSYDHTIENAYEEDDDGNNNDSDSDDDSGNNDYFDDNNDDNDNNGNNIFDCDD